MPYKTLTLRPPLLLPGGHLQTIIPALYRRVQPLLLPRRQRLETADGDFLDLEWYEAGMKGSDRSEEREESAPRPLAVLCHGFEGSSRSGYIIGMVNALLQAGFNCLAWNYRGCGDELNRLPIFYHSGATYDLQAVLAEAARQHPGTPISLVGFSLGGNLVLKYVAEHSQGRWPAPAITAAAAISVPCDLRASAMVTERGLARVYARRFLQSLEKKVRAKWQLMPHEARLDPSLLAKAGTIRLFDRYFTAPLFGYADEEAYYADNSSLFRLPAVALPTLLLSAANDPMISASSHPAQLARQHPHLHFWQSDEGGHCGFLQRGHPWAPNLAERLVPGFLRGWVKTRGHSRH